MVSGVRDSQIFFGFNFEGCSHWANKLFSLSLRFLNLKIGIVMGSNLYCYKKKVPKFKNLKKTYIVTQTRQFQSLGNTLPFLCFAYIGTHCYRGSYLASESCSTQNARKLLLFCRSWQSVRNMFVLPQVIQSYRLSSLSVLPTVSLMQMSIQLFKKVEIESLVIHDHNVEALCWMFKWVFPVCVKQVIPKFIFPALSSTPSFIPEFIYYLAPSLNCLRRI